MKIRCYLIDDDPFSIEGLSMLIEKIPGLILVGSETDAVAALSKVLSGAVIADIIFMDIDMPELNGMDLTEQIEGKGVVIFVTGHPSYALKAFDTEAADFLTKPVEMSELIRAVNKAKEKMIARERLYIHVSGDRYVFIKLGPRNIERVNLKNISQIEVDDKYLNIHVGKTKPLSVKKSLNYMEELLPPDLFIRVSKSCIINLDKLSSIVGNRVILDNGSVFEIGSSYMERVYTRYHAL